MLGLILSLLLVAIKTLGLAFLVLIILALDIPKRWKLRHIPGPPALPVLGNLPQVIKKGSPTFFRECRAKYGPVFRVAFGRGWMVVVAEPGLIRQVGNKLLNHGIFGSLMRPEFRMLDNSGLVEARDDYWRTVRAAWQPTFSAGNLAGYLPRMVDGAGQLAARLEGMAARAEQGGSAGAASPRVDIWRELGSMTLQVVGSTAYGVDFEAIGSEAVGSEAATQSTPRPVQQEQQDEQLEAINQALAAAQSGYASGGGGGGGSTGHYGRVLVQACRDFFRYSSVVYGSKYSRVALLLPELRALLRLAAHKFPDRPFAKLLQARRVLHDAGLSLIAGWKASAAAGGEENEAKTANGAVASEGAKDAHGAAHRAGDNNEANDEANDTLNSDTNGEAIDKANGKLNGDANGKVHVEPSAQGPPSGPGSGVAPGSFLNLVLAARDKATGERLSDLQVAAQVQTFILAGYETTANALAFTVYCLALNPEVESKMLEEIDSVLGSSRLPTEADLPGLVYTEAVFNEAMRLYPPAHATSRVADRGPFEVGGYSVPPGTNIFMSIFSAHHNPDVWPRVADFIPERFIPSSPLHAEVCARVPNAHAPFGYGSRLCVGWKFAIQEAKVALAMLYQRLRFELEPGQVPLQTAVGITLSPRNGVWVRPVRRRPTPTQAVVP